VNEIEGHPRLWPRPRVERQIVGVTSKSVVNPSSAAHLPNQEEDPALAMALAVTVSGKHGSFAVATGAID
jgi:hypothetical protein